MPETQLPDSYLVAIDPHAKPLEQFRQEMTNQPVAERALIDAVVGGAVSAPTCDAATLDAAAPGAAE